MYNTSIHKRIEHLGQVINDLKSCEADIQFTSDPSLKHELNEERNQLAEELDMVGRNCISVLEAYMEDCKDNDIPVFLDYWRVLVALRNAEVIG
jgi:hypothetical protein